MTDLRSIGKFLEQKHIAVAGVSRHKGKFGNSIFKELKSKGYEAYPVNPNIDNYEGVPCYNGPEALPDQVSAIIINTKPEVTKRLINEVQKKGIRHVWLQQGSADRETMESVAERDNYIAGKCIMMFLEPVGGIHKFHRFINKVFGSYPKSQR